MVAESPRQQPQDAVEVLLLKLTGKADTAEYNAVSTHQ